MNNNDNNLEKSEKSINQSKAIPVNQKVKDSLFKMIYQKEERLISLTNIPFRVLEYSVTGLRELIVSANSLYGSSRVYMPIPKFFAIQVGLGDDSRNLSNQILNDYHLSDSYMTDSSESEVEPDLDLIVHVFDLRMSSNEVLKYIEDNTIPDRFTSLDETV